jgi:hypothetical protein
MKKVKIHRFDFIRFYPPLSVANNMLLISDFSLTLCVLWLRLLLRLVKLKHYWGFCFEQYHATLAVVNAVFGDFAAWSSLLPARNKNNIKSRNIHKTRHNLPNKRQ